MRVSPETFYYVERLYTAMMLAQMQEKDPALKLSCNYAEEVQKILKEVEINNVRQRTHIERRAYELKNE